MTLLGPHDPDNAPPAFDRTGRLAAAAAASRWCCSSRWCLPALRPATSISAAKRPSRTLSSYSALLPPWRCSACSCWPRASCGSGRAKAAIALLKAAADRSFDAVLITDAVGPRRLRQQRLLAAHGDARRRGGAADRAGLHRRSAGIGIDLSAAQGGARGQAPARRGADRETPGKPAAGCGCASARSARREATRA